MLFAFFKQHPPARKTHRCLAAPTPPLPSRQATTIEALTTTRNHLAAYSNCHSNHKSRAQPPLLYEAENLLRELESDCIIGYLDHVLAKGGTIRSEADHVGIRGHSNGDANCLFGTIDVLIDRCSFTRSYDGVIHVIACSTGINDHILINYFVKHNQPCAFVDDFYAVDDPFNGQSDFEPLFGLDDIAPLVNVDGTVKGKGKAIEVDVVDKGKDIAIDDEIENLDDTEDEEQSSEEEESDGFMDVENPMEEVKVNMDSFDRTDADNMGYEQNPREFNANDEIEVDMDVMDPDEFECASDEDGKEFATADDVKKDIHKLSIETRRELFLKKNDKVRVRAECRGTIPVFEDTPQNGPSGDGPSQASRASDSVRGDYTLQYKMLRYYVMELKECNPNTTVRIGVETKEDHTSPTRIIKRIYVCLGASKAGFMACRREFLGLDGAFMKGPFPGKLLTAVGIDPNNGIYPLVYGTVETESRDLWTWFLEYLKDDLDLQDNFNFTFISDRQKVIPILYLFPTAEHRSCLRHIHQNMKQKWAGTTYKELLWNCATALTIPQFDRRMDRLKEFNKECYDWLALIPPQHWARAYFL
ncbi:mutator type transposase, partial [Tanacetum coccineum]